MHVRSVRISELQIAELAFHTNSVVLPTVILGTKKLLDTRRWFAAFECTVLTVVHTSNNCFVGIDNAFKPRTGAWHTLRGNILRNTSEFQHLWTVGSNNVV